MAQSLGLSVLTLALVAGCSSTLQAGLANAPALGKDTPETRVHDIVANGHDACERSAFPQGGVLRGQVPPCATESGPPATSGFVPQPSPPPASSAQWHGFGVCASAGEGFERTELPLAGASLASADLVCDGQW